MNVNVILQREVWRMKPANASFEFFRMRHPGYVLLAVLVMVGCLTGCQGTMLSTSNKGQTIVPSAQIKLVKAGEQSGRFSDGYVTVNYKYAASGGNLQMSGVVRFGSALSGNFQIVQTFDLGLLLGDVQGKVLMQQSLATAVENNVSDPVNFNTTVFLPPQATSMAFTYNGQAYGGGGESPTSFWADPVER
jgi:hypothetical protein